MTPVELHSAIEVAGHALDHARWLRRQAERAYLLGEGSARAAHEAIDRESRALETYSRALADFAAPGNQPGRREGTAAHELTVEGDGPTPGPEVSGLSTAPRVPGDNGGAR